MFHLQHNLPGWERALRLTLGVLAAVAGVTVAPPGGAWTWLLLATAATLVLTAFVGFCPACAMAGRRPLRRGP